MSAEYSVVYYGLKFPVSTEEVTALKKAAGFTEAPKLRLHFVPDI